MSARALRGFTLIELVVTVAIVAVLASAAMPLAELTAQRARESELRAALRAIRGGIDAYKAAFDANRIEREAGASGYPPDLEALVKGLPDITDSNSRKIYFLRRIPRDPFFTDPSVPPEHTWGLRSYASPPETPAEGDDVFDIHSMSRQIGLNGIPYREW